jgi:hypothetical protein
MTNNSPNLSEQQQREAIIVQAASKGFPEYSVAVDPRYQLEWFHNKIALRLERAVKQVENGEDVRLMIFMPPRHGKSDSATQKFPSWVLGQHPEWPFIVSSYSQELATDFGQGTRDLMDSTTYQHIFGTRLREDTKAKAKWMTQEGGGYTAVGVGGAITGRGFKVGIVDDPFKNREEADSPVTRDAVHKWWRSTFYTRQEGNTLILVILTRWHDDDLAGRLIKEMEDAKAAGEDNFDEWEILEFKALAEQDEEFRTAGEALWPQKFDRRKLLKTKQALGSYEFSALYQQNPIDEENQEFKKDWLRYRTRDEVDAMTTRKFATIDPAGSRRETSDYTGVTRNWVNDLNEWHFTTKKYRVNSKGIIDLIFLLHSEGFEAIGIEEGIYYQAVEPFLKEKMEEEGIYPNVVPLKHGGIMKETRIRGLIPRYENGKIFHIDNTCTDLEDEYLRFPKSAYDDCLDSAAYQNQLAAPPSAGVGDRVTLETMVANLMDTVNEQEPPVIIGLYAGAIVKYVVGNKAGIFYFEESEATDPYKDISDLIGRWKRCYVIAYQASESIGLKKLREKHPGRVFIAFFGNDPKSQEIIKWGEDDKFGDVTLARNALIQSVVDEFGDTRLPIYGTQEEWQLYFDEWVNMYRTWQQDETGIRIMNWESTGPQHFVIATLLMRAGLSRWTSAMATVVDGSGGVMAGAYVPKMPNVAKMAPIPEMGQVIATLAPGQFGAPPQQL